MAFAMGLPALLNTLPLIPICACRHKKTASHRQWQTSEPTTKLPRSLKCSDYQKVQYQSDPVKGGIAFFVFISGNSNLQLPVLAVG